MKGQKFSFIGGGNMAEAMLRGLLKNKIIAPRQLLVSEPREERARFLSRQYRIHVTSDNKAAAQFGEIIILAVKPQVIKEVLQEIAGGVTSKHLVISIAAGITIAFIASHLGKDKRIVRAMPNTPCQIGEGAIAFCGGGKANPRDMRVTREIFAGVGTTVIVPETHMDAVTGLSGSGPAYIFLIIEALTDGGVKMGLPRDVAQALVLQTIIGSGRMVLETGDHPSTLKDLVTSPGGTTIAGLQVLEEKGIRGALINAVVAASERSRELSRTRNL
ncbi:MAG TPA: pyrroline-5-carboxylate reductase [Thermodesulfobacteriota bacterium]|nr:pyrroline-5-carboxylate reductase [Thermodesulfobacteriota bacterium]